MKQKLATFQAPAWSGNSSQMESVPPCQLRMSDGLPARWTPHCQGLFTSCGCPLICVMTNEYPVKSQAGRHEIPMYVCVCMREGFYMLRRGSLFGGFQCEGAPLLGLLSCCSRRRRGGGEEVSEETGVIERGQRGRSDTGHQETHSVTHTHCDRTRIPYLTSQSGP